MNKFLVLFKHEMKMQFPLRPQKGKRVDLLGALLSVLMVIMISAVFVTILSSVVSNYALVKVNNVLDPIMRTKELLNVCYMALILVLTLAGLENMRRTLTEKKHSVLFLRIPVKQQTIFASKLLTLLISSYLLAFLLIGSVSLIFYLSVDLPATFWLTSFVVWLLMPVASFLFSTLLLVPYIKLIEFLGRRYLLMFVSVSAAVMGAFLLYSEFLETLRSLLETGSIKFLFNERFVNTLGDLLKWAYPARSYACIAMATELLPSLAIAVLIAPISALAVCLISHRLFVATLYKNESKVRKAKISAKPRKLSPLISLIKKEFITIFREPKNLFSYFAIAASMPLMVYCCYSMFESLILNMIGMSVSFPLAVTVVLIFSILTNTFCANNVTRDGAAAMKAKMFPVKASTILLSKVLLCGIVSSLSVIASLTVLVATDSLGIVDALILTPMAIAFSTAQIFIATRMDLNGARLSSNLAQMKSASNRTIAKVVALGLLLALASGLLSLVAYIFAQGSSLLVIAELGLKRVHAYLLPYSISLVYLGSAVAYYGFKIEKSLDGLTL